jgi:hypothetical protein
MSTPTQWDKTTNLLISNCPSTPYLMNRLAEEVNTIRIAGGLPSPKKALVLVSLKGYLSSFLKHSQS